MTAQNELKPPRELRVGDSVEGYALNGMINYPDKRAPFSDFKGKLLILEFWSTTCGSCIAMWPKLLSLQKEFAGKVQIVLVNTYQDQALVKKTLEKRQRLAGVQMDLPIACADTVMGKQLFPHSGVPFLVWIDGGGIIKSITPSAGLTKENIQAMLVESETKMDQYIANDKLIHPDYGRPLLADTSTSDSKQKLVQYSLLTHADPRLWPGIGLPKNNQTGNYYAVASNYTARDMYRIAYSSDSTYHGQIEMVPLNRTVSRLSDSSRYVYQLISPSKTKWDIQQKMRKDLDRLFSARVHWEKQVKPCLVLSMQDTTLMHYHNQDGVIFKWDDNQLSVNKLPVKYLVLFMMEATKYQTLPYPLLDETGFTGLLDHIQIEADVNDYKKLDQALARYKMSLKVENRQVNVLIIDEPSGEVAISRSKVNP